MPDVLREMTILSSPSFWIGTVSREHVLRGVAGGFAMLNHGKRAPVERLCPGDWLIYYSPKTAIDGSPLKAFTAIGTVSDRPPYAAEMGANMTGWRRDMVWLEATETPIAGLTDKLEFTRGNWGMLARRGLFNITQADFQTIRSAMSQE